MQKTFFYQSRGNGGGSLIMGIIFIVLMVLLFRGAFILLRWATPVLLIATVIINYRVLLDYGKWIVAQVRSNPLMGIALGLLSFVFFPFLVFYLFGKAVLTNKTRQSGPEYLHRESEQFVPFEEMESMPNPMEKTPEKETVIVEEAPAKAKAQEKSNEYDQLFNL